MYSRLYAYLLKNNLLYKYQFGFRKNHSTSLALVDVLDTINKYSDKHGKGIAIYLDLQKGFDTVDHDILLYKMYNYGIRGELLKWFRSYLSDRQQYVCVLLRVSANPPTLTDESLWHVAVERVPVVPARHYNTSVISVWMISLRLLPVTILDVYTSKTCMKSINYYAKLIMTMTIVLFCAMYVETMMLMKTSAWCKFASSKGLTHSSDVINVAALSDGCVQI